MRWLPAGQGDLHNAQQARSARQLAGLVREAGRAWVLASWGLDFDDRESQDSTVYKNGLNHQPADESQGPVLSCSHPLWLPHYR